ALLTSSRIIKTGHDISRSVIAIAAAFGMPELDTLFRQFDSPFLDLGKLAKVKGAVRDVHVPLSSLIPAVLKKRYPDSLPSLPSESQKIKFLASEVDCIWELYVSLSRCGSVGLPLQPSEAKVGQPVTLVSACKEIAEGIILDHNGCISVVMDENGNEVQLRITPAYSLVRIEKVIVPGAIIKKHNQTLEWIFKHGRKAIVQTRTLRTRPNVPPLPLNPSSTSLLGIPASAPSFPASDSGNTTIGPSPELLAHAQHVSDGDDDSVLSDAEDDLETEGDEEEEQSPFNDDEDIMGPGADEDELNFTPEELLINSFRTAQDLLTQGEVSTPLASRVLDDSFHFMERLTKTLPKKHTAFKEFAHQMSETIFIRDAKDVEAVKTVLDSKDISWEYM
ncbi:hypothetical protein EV361DRAFT_874884, partial [Lentinula raphanica]